MCDVLENTVIPILMMPFPELQTKGKIYEHALGDYYYYCSCNDCKMFFAHGNPIRCVDPRTLKVALTPRYNYMGLVNSMRAASAKREEERQDKLQAESDGRDDVESPGKEKVSKTLNEKTLRQATKRRRL